MRHDDAMNQNPKHDAVARRDRTADGSFVYSVRSTGVYCLPSCPSRRPLPENIAFHDTPAAAEAAGFRPCRRCRPEIAGRSHPHRDAVIAACRRIEREAASPTLTQLAAASTLSPQHFHRVFRAMTGVTPKAYATSVRAARLRGALAGAGSVTQALYDCGFNAASRFYARADAMLGMAPRSWRRAGEGETLRFVVGSCALGEILVAGSAYGICTVDLGSDAGTLVRDFQERFARADIVPGDARFGRLAARVIALVETGGGDPELPLDIRGTVFQHRVWEALRAIPMGQTLSYAELAAHIGAPAAVRAVAGACAANRLAVLIPCHRIVRGDGSASGYRWEVARKRALLLREGA